MKNVMVLFSGGIDSTYLVYKNLKEGNIVFPVYIDFENNYEKGLIEKQQIDILYNMFSKGFPGKIREPEKGVKCYTEHCNISTPQLPFQIISIIYSQYFFKVDEVHIGYIKNELSEDGAFDIQRAYHSFKGLIFDAHNNDKKMPELVFPLKDMSKKVITHFLPEEYLQETFSCEVPVVKGVIFNAITGKFFGKPKKDKNGRIIFKNCNACHACYTQKEEIPDFYDKKEHTKHTRRFDFI